MPASHAASSAYAPKKGERFFFHWTSSMNCRSIMQVATTAAWPMQAARPCWSPAKCFLNSDSSLVGSPRTLTALSARPLRRLSCSTAFSVTPRASGSAMLLAFVSSAGSRRGRKGAASMGLSTSLDMLLMMTADWRLVAICFSLSPRRRRGTTMARAGDSTDCTKVTPAISCMISGTSFGLLIAMRIFSVMCSMSLFPMTLRASLMAAVAACLICFFVSHMHAVTSGTTSGKAFPSCFGAVSPRDATHLSASSRICHFFSTGRAAKRTGRRDLTPKGLVPAQIARDVDDAASLTDLDFDEACSRHGPRHSLVSAWASGQSDARDRARAMPARASFSSPLPHLAASPSMDGARPDFSIPSDLTVAARDDSSPRERVASFSSIDMVYYRWCAKVWDGRGKLRPSNTEVLKK
mmetsp:Transcript_20126/g.46152  ORF Transcript_20126/g.46152 Transcript_20126/m.46152 type:complete len:409 (+) Transcript_20126:2046-3272(+)